MRWRPRTAEERGPTDKAYPRVAGFGHIETCAHGRVRHAGTGRTSQAVRGTARLRLSRRRRPWAPTVLPAAWPTAPSGGLHHQGKDRRNGRERRAQRQTDSERERERRAQRRVQRERSAPNPPKCLAVALFFCVRAISSSISLIFSSAWLMAPVLACGPLHPLTNPLSRPLSHTPRGRGGGGRAIK